MVKNLSCGTGRRKTSVARVYLRKGKGEMVINGKKAEEYFLQDTYINQIKKVLTVTDSDNKYSILINVKGGGMSGQAGACVHGLARALDSADESNHTALKANRFLTRDDRMVERKKYGQRGARRRFQFSKR